ncbi:MAG: hypothetical protein HFI37_04195 [Lachnospiraceae bacterium]|jgi:hypothetical protein|nr:hypothetical protein [Lachnospiraceae bacterium]
MSNTIYVDSMTKAYHNFAKSYKIANQQQPVFSFADKIAEKNEESGHTSAVSIAGAVSVENMTLEQYKQYIHDQISGIPLDPSQSGWYWRIEITDEGFEAMKNDPEYEKQVLSAIRSNFSYKDPFHSQNYVILHFGATEEESYGLSFGGGSPALQEEEKTFWERRAQQREEQREQYEEMLDRKALAHKLRQSAEGKKAAAMQAQKSKSMQPWNQGKPPVQMFDVYGADLLINTIDVMDFLNGE